MPGPMPEVFFKRFEKRFYVYFKVRITGKEKEAQVERKRDPLSSCSLIEMAPMDRLKPEVGNFSRSFTLVQVSKNLGHLLLLFQEQWQGTQLEIEQLGLKPLSI